MPLHLSRKHSWNCSLSRLFPLLALGTSLLTGSSPQAVAQSTGAQSTGVQSTGVQSSGAQPTAVQPAAVQSQTNPVVNNQVVAVVNADPITRNMLADASIQRHGSEILDNMINRYLILQECNHRGIEVTKQEVSDEIRRLAGKFGLTPESYLKLLEEERDITPGQYSREIIWPMLALRRLVADDVKVTEDEFNQAYVSQFGEAVKCRLIMAANRTKAVDLQTQAVANPDQFSQLAKQHSEDEASASVGGLIPPIRRYSGDSRLEAVAFGLETGAVSDVLQLGDQWIVLQAVRRIPPSNPSPQALPAIREQINDRVRDQKMRGAATDLFSRLQKEAQVVKVLGDAEQTKQHPGVAAIINGEQILVSQVGEECIKRFGSKVLEGEINRKLLMQALRKDGKQVTDADLNAEIARAAIDYGFVSSDGKPDLESWFESVTTEGRTTRDLYISDVVWPSVALRKLVEGQIQISEQEMVDGFESSYGPRVEILAIVLSDQRSAQKIWEMARDNPTDEFFGKLAEQYSTEPVSTSNQGKVPPIRKHSGQPAVEKEAFSLKPGELSGIIATGGQFLILRCQGFTEPIVTDPAAVRSELLRDLSEAKTNRAMSERFEKLIETSEIDNFLEAESAARVATTRRD